MEEIKQAIKDLELQLNYICYDPVMIEKLSTLWDKLQALQAVVNKTCNLPVVVESEAVVCPKCKSEHTQKRGYGFECIECWHKF